MAVRVDNMDNRILNMQRYGLMFEHYFHERAYILAN